MNKNTDTKKNILEQIETGQISMRPKAVFVIKTFAFAFAIIIGLLFTLFLFSFIVFILKGTGMLSLSDFGGRGMMLLLFSIPWLLVIAVMALVILLEVLAKHFAFVYRKPAVYSTLAILVLVIFAGSAIAATPIHKNIYSKSSSMAVPVGSVYKHYGHKPPRGALVGEIKNINEKGMVVELIHTKEAIPVSTTTKTRYPRTGELSLGDRIIVIGREEEGVYRAYGIRTFNDENLPFTIQLHKHGATLKMK